MKIEIKKLGKEQKVYSFNKVGYSDPKVIESLYITKIEQLLNGRKEADLSESEKQINLKLQRSIYYDPRLPDVYFVSEETVRKAQQIADKLHKMTQDEFLSGEYSYQWLDELTGTSLYKVIDPSILTSVQPNDLVRAVLDIVNSSDRRMPAHFTSNGNRTQSFCVNFDISEADEYAMASEAWGTATDPSIIKIGEDVMLAAYIAVKLGGEEYISELQDIILKHNLSEIPDLQTQSQYLQNCADYGKYRSKITLK